MYQENKILKYSIIFIVILLHAVILVFALSSRPPEITLSEDSLSFVDLSGMSESGATATQAQNTANTTLAPAIKPKEVTPPPPPKEEPVKEEEPKIEGIEKPDEKPDIVKPKPKPKKIKPKKKPEKPKPKPEPKPEPKVEPKPQPEQKAPEKPKETEQSNSSSQALKGKKDISGTGLGAKGKGNGTGTGVGSGGNTQGSVVPPTHLGGYLHNPKPPYPAISREEGEEGTVTLKVFVTADGRAKSVSIVKSSGYARLDRSARDTVRRYRFTPATRAGIPIDYSYTFDIKFNLQDD